MPLRPAICATPRRAGKGMMGPSGAQGHLSCPRELMGRGDWAESSNQDSGQIGSDSSGIAGQRGRTNEKHLQDRRNWRDLIGKSWDILAAPGVYHI
jgi:hypothetical protein